ncbi:hypothetical protein CC1G_02112 [Coprinopsis cinerea okayama7|uniref:F-box domain-containing protein n=1 Tax=Coprinopsis cinerea (strain Okayama-7 / 130 / ATCC MYA-4618 / FGSC 9003) TaxID=240176 RepID=A8NK84_COPC7|nr:hypothetical protein CC1G_02112 [Coprinopsis cinerea okayama7\|eukprot:XP_001834376.2 hypothetical protein CC1G_02112 [Coprinopsis cinerea okayama7\
MSTPKDQPITIDAFPNELLSNIFALYVRASHTPNDPRPSKRIGRIEAVDNSPNSPVLLGWVSSRWRAVALSTVGLWSTIVVRNPLPRDVGIFKQWLERSRGALLDLTLSRNMESNDGAPFHNILLSAAAESSRWRSINLAVLDEDLEDVFDPKTLILSNLKHAQYIHEIPDRGLKRRFYECIFTSPVLIQCRIEACSIEPTWVAGPAWNSLRSVVIDTIDTTGLIKMLAMCPLIEQCMVNIMFLSPSESVHRTTVTVPTLRLLHLAYVERYLQFLDYLALPSLTDFRFSILRAQRGTDGASSLWGKIKDFGARSLCKLKYFEYGYNTSYEGGHSDHEMGDNVNLPMFSEVLELSLLSKVTDTTVTALAFKDSLRPLPRLKTLNLECCDSTDGVLSNTILSRTTSGDTTLKEVSVVFGGSPEERSEDLSLEQKLDPTKVTLKLGTSEEYESGLGYTSFW